jgi:hypothetical protein
MRQFCDKKIWWPNPIGERAACLYIARTLQENAVRTLAQTVYLDSSFGTESELPRAGSSLENPFVYDASARELKDLAQRGLIEVIEERRHRVGDEELIDSLRFRRLR